MFWVQVRNMNAWVHAVVASTQMNTNTVLSNFAFCVIAIVQDHKLDITEDILNRIVVGTAFRQADPMELQVTHRLTGLARFTWVSAILIQCHPHRAIWIPLPQAAHELLNIGCAFAWQKHPAHPATDSIIADKEVKVSMCFLVACQHQTFDGSVAFSTVGFDRDRLDIEEQEMPTGGQMSENPAQASQNCRSLGILTDELALHPPEVHTVFLATGADVHVRWISQYVA